MSSIITFYSYKGGVGRSMTLANIAYEISRRNHKVLIVDWDLEAPGIERYFYNFKIDNHSDGLLQLLLAFKNDDSPNYRDYLWEIYGTSEYPISLMHSGREKDPGLYASLLQNFDWVDFFSNGKGGHHLENLRKEWHNDYDFVLIDSRTGLSDASGICTILMPDILVPMFTANYQSLFGIRDTVEYVQAARQKLEVDRMALTVLPIPSRFGTRVEFKESIEWLDRIADILKDCYSDWLPKWIEPRYILEQIKVPQIDYFSFGEKLAVVEQGTNDPEGMGFIFSKIATLLASDFSDIENFVGKEHYQSKRNAYKARHTSIEKQKDAEYIYDVFLSYPREIYEWVRELLIPALTEYLNDELGYNPQLFFDMYELNSGDSFSNKIETAVERSKSFVYIITDSSVNNKFLGFELQTILKREKEFEGPIIFPIAFGHSGMIVFEDIPHELQNRHFIDFSYFKYEDTIKSTKLRSQFGQTVERLSENIAQAVKLNNASGGRQNEGKTDNIEELLQLAREYEAIRKEMASGGKRTRVMENIVTKMKTVSNNPTNFLPTLTASKSPGERLAAIAKLQKFPNLDYINWLSEHVGDIEKPFIGYHASVALYLASRNFGQDHRGEVESTLEKARANIEKYNYKDPNQVSVIQSALNELDIK